MTSERLLFIGIDGRSLAFSIFKIDAVEVIAPDRFAVTVWYGRLQLAFDNKASARSALNVPRQDSRWAAAEMVRPDMGPAAVPQGGTNLSTALPTAHCL